MSAEYEDILARRRVLLGEIARQRHSLGQQVELFAAPLAVVDQGLVAVRFVQRHPLLVAGAASVLLTLGRRGNWFGRGLVAWRMISEFGRIRGINLF